jgi:hypothetical protein
MTVTEKRAVNTNPNNMNQNSRAIEILAVSLAGTVINTAINDQVNSIIG